MIRKDFPRGINIKVALNGIKFLKAKQQGKEKEFLENQRKERKLNNQEKIKKRMYEFSKSMVEYIDKKDKITNWPDLMDTLNNELDLDNMPNQDGIRNEANQVEEKQEEKDVIIQTNSIGSVNRNGSSDSNGNENVNNNINNINNGNSNNNNNNNAHDISIFEQSKKEIDYTMKTMEMIKGIKSKIYNDFKKENEIDSEVRIGKEKKKSNGKSNRINKYDMYDKLSNFDLDKLDLGGIHGYRPIEARNNGIENIPSLRIGNRNNEASILQRRSDMNGRKIANGSSDFDENELGSMTNVSRRKHDL